MWAGPVQLGLVDRWLPEWAGLLHELGRALADAGTSARSAHICTIAGLTPATFSVIGAAGAQLGPAAVARTVSAVIEACDGDGDEGSVAGR